ncbi:unnamed protein product [marine sediment metagenome]|uniref:Uncharacterized protein n=1 Tax=marine sediment metagenome TaxID=412755 RepID=X0XJ69_9ZZZZ
MAKENINKETMKILKIGMTLYLIGWIYPAITMGWLLYLSFVFLFAGAIALAIGISQILGGKK